MILVLEVLPTTPQYVYDHLISQVQYTGTELNVEFRGRAQFILNQLK